MVRTKKAAAGSNEPPVPPEDVFYTREQAGDAVKEYKKTKGDDLNQSGVSDTMRTQELNNAAHQREIEAVIEGLPDEIRKMQWTEFVKAGCPLTLEELAGAENSNPNGKKK